MIRAPVVCDAVDEQLEVTCSGLGLKVVRRFQLGMGYGLTGATLAADFTALAASSNRHRWWSNARQRTCRGQLAARRESGYPRWFV